MNMRFEFEKKKTNCRYFRIVYSSQRNLQSHWIFVQKFLGESDYLLRTLFDGI